MKNLLIILFCTIMVTTSIAQSEKTQTVRGKVVDKVSQMTLIGVVILIEGTEINTMTDIDGNFVLENVPIGRQVIQTQYLGYEPYFSEDLIISTSKEPYLDIALVEQVEVTETVVVKASKGADGVGNKALNDLSVVSTRSFSVEETKRYAASVDDPGRMAVALPGIQADQDTENDVIIRGNSAFGVSWKMEGLDIPNPSHFARPNTTGGGITVFSAAVLGNTDVSTSAFAAEYGNAISGVFDMRTRKGNKIKREHSIKIGLLGVGASTEGPFKKGQSSYLVNYRYSTLGILNLMGLYVIRDNVANNFQDLSFALTFNSKDNKDEFKIFGVGGLSNENWFQKDIAEWESSLDYVTEVSGSNMGLLGFSYRRLLDDKSYLKVVVGSVFNHTHMLQDQPIFSTQSNLDSLEQVGFSSETILNYDYKTLRSQAHLTYSNKISNQFRIKAGASLTANTYWLNYNELTTKGNEKFLDNLSGNTFLVQAYAQGSYRPVNKLTINFGFHAMYLALNNTFSIEPRVSLQYKPFKKTTFAIAYGIHGKELGIGTYLLQVQDSLGNRIQPNKNLEIAKAHHAVFSFRQALGYGFRINAEAYYQYHFDNPTGAGHQSGYWLFNERDNYGNQAMVSQGQAQNYGADLTVEKAFSNNFFAMVSGSLYWTQFKSRGDTEWRRSRNDRRWATTIMGGYEFTFKKGGVLQLGIKSFISGGVRYNPGDLDASKTAGVFVPGAPVDNDIYSEQGDTYFRLDARIAYRKDHKKLSYTISLDVQNCTNTKNVRYKIYDCINNELINRPQSGLLPVLAFQLDF